MKVDQACGPAVAALGRGTTSAAREAWSSRTACGASRRGAAFTAAVAALKAAGVPEKDAVDVARENNPLPPQRARSERRSAGREKHTATERAEWRELNERQREQPDLHPGHAKAERVQLARRQTSRRKRQKVFAPLMKLKLWQPAPDTSPGRTEPTPKATTARISGRP